MRNTWTNSSSLSFPMPVSTSGVRFIEYTVPNFSLWLVNVGPITHTSRGPSLPDGSGAPSGWPESMRDQSGAGAPSFGLNTHGVWQSLHNPAMTSSLPSSTRALGYEAADVGPTPGCTGASAIGGGGGGP